MFYFTKTPLTYTFVCQTVSLLKFRIKVWKIEKIGLALTEDNLKFFDKYGITVLNRINFKFNL